MAGTEVSLRDDINATLKFVSSKARKGCIIGVMNDRRSLRFGLGTLKAKRDHNQDDTQFQHYQTVAGHGETHIL